MSEWHVLRRWAEGQVRETVDRLPPGLRDQAASLPVTYERIPSPELQQDGVETDTLGLFVGEPFAETGSTVHPIPAQIILFLENLWEFSDGNEDVFLDEVHTTYLHELGHYLGLDEDDLFDRELD